MSQLDLALAVGSSARHVSFIETGRAQPSRDMVARLAEALDVPLRERNALFAAAGFAPLYRDSGLGAEALAGARRALDFMLAKQEPYPALVMNRLWDIVMANEAATRSLTLLGAMPADARPPNALRMIFHPDGLRPCIVDWEEVARRTLARAHREALAAPGDPAVTALIEEMLSYPGVPRDWRKPGLAPELPVVPVTLARGSLRMAWFTTITTFGTAQDVGLHELRIESFFPADEATERTAHRLADEA